MVYVKVNHEPRDCEWCHESFKPKTSHQFFCSQKCYKRQGKKHYGHSVGVKKTRKIRRKENRRGKRYGYRKYKLDHCQKCGFIPEHLCQLDVDHIDGNHKNNNPDNLQTLCANCHRLKSYRDRYAKPPED